MTTSPPFHPAAPIAIGAALLAAAASVPAQQQVFRAIDARGHVSFSSEPPDGADIQRVERIELPPGPSDEARRAAEERAARLIQEADQLGQRRQAELEQSRAATSANETALRDAQAALDAARAQQPDDWQTLAGGGRVLRQSYFDRVQKAETRLREAQQAARSR